jgi:hypothetical protein
MSDDPNKTPQEGPQPQGQPDTYSEQVHQSQIAARLPERVGAGVFSTGVIVIEGPEEFVVDFVQGLTRPPRVGSRVVMNPNVMAQFIAALRENLHRYEQAFGAPKPLPTPPPPERRPTVQEIYQDLRLPDEMLSGAYATTVMIGHSPSEFFMDFITRFFPNAAVSARVYMAASQVPRMLQALSSSYQNRQQRVQDARRQPPPAQPPMS